MTYDAATQVIATRLRSCLFITLPADLLPEVIDSARTVTLEGLHRGGSNVVVFELSAVRVMDREDFESLRDLTSMTRLLGARPVWVGLRPGVVMHLAEIDVDTSEIEAVRDLEEALARVDANADADADADEAPDDADTAPEGAGSMGVFQHADRDGP
jgi:rsbT antagonist protein RsbS